MTRIMVTATNAVAYEIFLMVVSKNRRGCRTTPEPHDHKPAVVIIARPRFPRGRPQYFKVTEFKESIYYLRLPV
jgi:hypothetical protein